MRPDSLSILHWAAIYTKVNSFVQFVCYRESVENSIPNTKDAKLGLTFQSYESYLNCVIKGFISNPTSNASGGTSPYHFIKKSIWNLRISQHRSFNSVAKEATSDPSWNRGQNRRCKTGQNGGSIEVWSQSCQMRAPSTQSVFNLPVTSNTLLCHLLTLHTFCPAAPNLRLLQWEKRLLGNSVQELWYHMVQLKTEEQQAFWLMCKITVWEFIAFIFILTAVVNAVINSWLKCVWETWTLSHTSDQLTDRSFLLRG